MRPHSEWLCGGCLVLALTLKSCQLGMTVLSVRQCNPLCNPVCKLMDNKSNYTDSHKHSFMSLIHIHYI